MSATWRGKLTRTYVHHTAQPATARAAGPRTCSTRAEAQRLARIEASEFYSAQIDASADPDGGWDPDGGLDDDAFGASWDDEALDELGA